MPQIRIGIFDLEGRPVDLTYDFERRTGSYSIRGYSKYVAGSIAVGTIRTQLRPATTREEILSQLLKDPAGLMIEMIGASGWITPDSRAQGMAISMGGHDECSEYIPSLCLVAELLREGLLELDGEGVVKIQGYAYVPALGSWFDDGIIGKDLSLRDCYDRIDGWGSHGLVAPKEKPDWNTQLTKLSSFLKFEDNLSMLRCSAENDVPH